MSNHYATLGLDRTASPDDIKAAYRRGAKLCHPDLHPGDATASEKFTRIVAAYEALSDPDARASYDRRLEQEARKREAQKSRPRPAERSPAPAPRRKPMIATQDVRITLRQAHDGAPVTILVRIPGRCAACAGSGVTAGRRSRCPSCGGEGIREVIHPELDMLIAIACPHCDGDGVVTLRRVCADCSGVGTLTRERRLDVRIPAGIGDGDTVRLKLDDSELHLRVKVVANKRFDRHGDDLLATKRLSASHAAKGTTFVSTGLDGVKRRVTVPPATDDGSVLRLRGLGMPQLGTGRRGDLLIRIEVKGAARSKAA